MKKERPPTEEEFEKLLLWINQDRDEAARKLIQIESRVSKIFMSRGCEEVEALTSEVTNRIAVRIDRVSDNYQEPMSCFIGFVGKVYWEYLRDEDIKRKVKPPPQARSHDELEREDRCLKKCLSDLEPSERNIVERYFGGEGAARREERKKLAMEQNITANALRIQAHRLRKKTLNCLRECLDEGEAKR